MLVWLLVLGCSSPELGRAAVSPDGRMQAVLDGADLAGCGSGDVAVSLDHGAVTAVRAARGGTTVEACVFDALVGADTGDLTGTFPVTVGR